MVFTREHLEAIAAQPHLLGKIVGKDKLTDLHSEWIKYIWCSDESTALQAHRGSYKTTAVAEIGTIVWLLFHPDDRIAIVRKSFTDAAEVTQTISIMMRMPAVRELFKLAHGFFPKATVDREGKLLFNFKKTVTPEPSVSAHGLDYGLTGKHYDRILLDDFVTLRDRTSKAEREKSKEVLREIMTNIIDPGQPVSFIGTPWHKNDAWTLTPEPQKYDVWAAQLLTQEEIEKKQKTTTPVLFAANYLLEHQSDDMAIFKDPIYSFWDHNYRRNYAHIDSAYDGDHYCALTIQGKLPDGRRQAIGFVSPGNVKQWLDFIEAQYKKYNCIKIFGETNADKGYTNDELKKRGLNVMGYAEHENKHIKISTHGFQHWYNTVWANDTDPEYMEQMLDYREGQEPDDAPDSFASLNREAFNASSQKSMAHNSALFKF